MSKVSNEDAQIMLECTKHMEVFYEYFHVLPSEVDNSKGYYYTHSETTKELKLWCRINGLDLPLMTFPDISGLSRKKEENDRKVKLFGGSMHWTKKIQWIIILVIFMIIIINLIRIV